VGWGLLFREEGPWGWRRALAAPAPLQVLIDPVEPEISLLIALSQLGEDT